MEFTALSGFWTKKDFSCYLFIDRTHSKGKNKGKCSGIRYFIRPDGKYATDKGKFVINEEDLKKDYVKGMKTNGEDNKKYSYGKDYD